MKQQSYLTTDLCDAHSDKLRIAEPIFNDYGGVQQFHGQIVTVKVFEDNVLVKQTLNQKVDGDVLVVDGGGSCRCALLGDMLAGMGQNNGWSGIIINGCIRDSVEINQINIGVKAINTHPLKSIKRGEGQKQLDVNFAGVTFKPGEYIYADEDGVIVSAEQLDK